MRETHDSTQTLETAHICSFFVHHHLDLHRIGKGIPKFTVKFGVITFSLALSNLYIFGLLSDLRQLPAYSPQRLYFPIHTS